MLRWMVVASGTAFLLIGAYWLVAKTQAQGGQNGWASAFIAVAGLALGLAQVVLAGSALRTNRSPGVTPGLVKLPTGQPGMASLTAPGVVAAHIRGRDGLVRELAGLYRWRARREARVRVLYGMGGAGKSTVAQLLARRLATAGVRVWWISAASAMTLQTGTRQLAVDLGVSDTEMQRAWSGLGGLPDLLWRLLTDYSGRWLLVIDNADDTRLLAAFDEPVAAGRGWIRSVPTRRGLLLITTRDGDPAAWLPSAVPGGGDPGSDAWCRMHQVGMLALDEGARVLVEYAGDRAGSMHEAAALASRLGCLPLALALAGQALADAQRLRLPGSVTTFAQYQTALDSGQVALLDAPQGPLTDAAARRLVSRTWEMSLDLLDARGLPEGRGLLRLLSTFADAPVPTGLLDCTAVAASPLFPGLRLEHLQQLLQALAALGLITIDSTDRREPVAAAIRLHPLIRDTTNRSPRIGGDPVAYLTLAVTLLAGFASGDPDDSRHWPIWRTATPHAVHLLTEAMLVPDTGLVIRAADVVEGACRYLNSAGVYATAHDQYAALLSIRERVQGADHPDTLTTRHRLAYSAGWAGDAAAARDQFAVLVPIRERVLGADHPDTLGTRKDLARWTGEAGDLAAARDQFAALLPVSQRVLGTEHPDTLATQHGLAQWTGWAGDAAAARDQFVVLVPVRERVLGAEHPDTLATRHRLAQWTGWAGNATAARDQLAALIDLCQRVLGVEHPDTLHAKHDLARWTGYAGDPAVARDQFAALLSTSERVLGAEHPDSLATRHGLALWTGKAGDSGSARDQFAALLPIRERVQGIEHPDSLGTRHELAYWTGKAQDIAAAREQFAALLPIRERVLGVEHPDTLDTRRELASCTRQATRS